MAGNGILKMGAEIHANDFNVYQQNLTNPAKPTQDTKRPGSQKGQGQVFHYHIH
jgi:hypothetical protein